MQGVKTFDFIVIGSGIAGLNAALTLSEFGKVLIVTKKKLKNSSTYLAQGGIAAVIKNDDSLTSHHTDTIIAGYYHNKKKAVAILVKGGKDAVKRLAQLGVPFDKHKNEYVSSYEAAHSYPRILHATDFTGQKIEETLIAHILKNKFIETWEDTMAIDLLIKDKQCYGLQVVKNNEVINLFSRAVILATGGIGQLYQWTTNPEVATGDGIALANRAGAKIKDMEFVQFHPTALAEQSSPLLLLSEALRGEGAILLNSQHERFMQRYHSQKELAPRDVVARAIIQEQKKGPVFLDISHKDKSFILARFPNLSRELQKRGFDLTIQPIPVTPAVHFLCGGIATDSYGKTSIKNLFAYGETAATGVHGANRLASNSLLEGMVFSSRIKYCIGELPKHPIVARSLSKALLYKDVPHNNVIRTQIRTIMWQHVGIIRTSEGLTTARKELEELLTAQVDNETKNMLTVALLVTESAQKRKKSLGTHFISDSQTDLLQYTNIMPQLTVNISLVVFKITSGALCIYAPDNKLPCEAISETETLNGQVQEMFAKHLGFPLGKNYAEQLYTFSTDEKAVTIAYYVLIEKTEGQTEEKNWKKVSGKKFSEQEIISYAVQRLRWKIEYTNVVYSLLPKTFTLSDLQKTYEIILGKKLDKRNFRKKILSLKFLKPTGEKRTINSRPARTYGFTTRSAIKVKVFS